MTLLDRKHTAPRGPNLMILRRPRDYLLSVCANACPQQNAGWFFFSFRHGYPAGYFYGSICCGTCRITTADASFHIAEWYGTANTATRRQSARVREMRPRVQERGGSRQAYKGVRRRAERRRK